MVHTVTEAMLRNRAATVSTRRAFPLMSRPSSRLRIRLATKATAKMTAILAGRTTSVSDSSASTALPVDR